MKKKGSGCKAVKRGRRVNNTLDTLSSQGVLARILTEGHRCHIYIKPAVLCSNAKKKKAKTNFKTNGKSGKRSEHVV